MNDYKRNSRPTYEKRPPFRKGGFRSDTRDAAPRDLHDAECSNCHAKCQVPFRPNGKKPVYCANCFTKDEAADRNARAPQRTFASRSQTAAPQVADRQMQELKQQLQAINGTLEKLLAAVTEATRANELAKEVRKHVPAKKPAPAPARSTKKAAAPAKRTGVRKAAKK